MMYNTFEAGLVKSGNVVLLETPVLMNMKGEIVQDEADAYGQAVTLRHTRPENVLVADETGSSTREMGDGQNGGQRCMAPIGETPRYEASGKHSHFTVVPFTRLSGDLVMVAVILFGRDINDLEFGSDSEEEGGEGEDKEDSVDEEEDSGREEEDNDSESEDDLYSLMSSC